jgi:hypothetical protein
MGMQTQDLGCERIGYGIEAFHHGYMVESNEKCTRDVHAYNKKIYILTILFLCYTYPPR